MSDPPETIQLLRQWHGGDRRGLDALLERDLEWIRAKVESRLGDLLKRKGDREDYVQEAMLHVLKYGPRFQIANRDQFRALLAQLIENVLRDEVSYHRAKRRAAAREERLPTQGVLDLDSAVRQPTRPSVAADRELEREWLELALGLLEPQDREILELRQWDGLRFGEIGEKLGIPENTARMRFSRALPRLARVVKDLQNGKLSER